MFKGQANLLVDGNMEANNTDAWTADNGAVLSKQTTNPYRGMRVLRVADGTELYPSARQTLIVGTTYRVTGVARGDGRQDPEYIWEVVCQSRH